MEKTGANVVRFKPEGNPWIPAVIRSAAGFDGVTAPALSGDLRLFVSAAKNSVQPGFPLFLPPGDLWAGAIGCNLHVFVGKNRRGKDGANVAFDPEPIVCEVNHGSVDTDGGGIEGRGLEAQHAGGETAEKRGLPGGSRREVRSDVSPVGI